MALHNADMTERSTIMFAMRLPSQQGGTCLSGFMHDEQVAKIFYCKPVERVIVRDLRENESSEYWAWWNARKGYFDFVFTARVGVEMCFPYGSSVETKKGNGEVVNVMVEAAP